VTQSNILSREQAVYLGLESTFGVTPAGSFPNAMTRFVAAEPVIVDGAVREMLDVNDIRVRRLDAIQPVQGLEIASKLTVSQLLKATPSASQLTAGTSPAALTPRILLTHAFGQENASQGDVVSTATSATQFDVANPGRFRIGTWIAVEVAGQMEYALIVAKTSNTLSVVPDLSAAPTLGGIVRNLYNYVPAETHSNSITAQIAYVNDASAQYTFNGCHGGVKFNFGEFGKLVTMSSEFTSTSYTGPTAQGLSTATATDEMGRGFPLAPDVLLFTSAPDRAVKLVCEKFAIEFNNAFEMVRDPSAVQTVNSVVNTAGRPRAGKVMITLRFDSDYGTGFDAETQYGMVIAQRIGSGTTASYWIWSMPTMKLTAQPKLTKVGERLYMDLEFSLLQSTVIAPVGGESAAQLDFLYAPLGVAFG